MARENQLERTLQELEGRVAATLERLARLEHENQQLRARLTQAEQERSTLRDRLKIMLDRIESLG
ncbi:MAG: hypothetical protein ABIK62_07665 [candidate division WOR-3 bacterium]